MLEFYAEILKVFGTQIDLHTVTTSAQAVQLCHQHSVDLVTTDLKRNDEPGEFLVAKLHQEFPRLPIVIISAHPACLPITELFRLGAIAYIEKPFDMDDYLRQIGELLHLNQPTT
jgi:DNA-binding NtrC family response regulator